MGLLIGGKGFEVMRSKVAGRTHAGELRSSGEQGSSPLLSHNSLWSFKNMIKKQLLAHVETGIPLISPAHFSGGEYGNYLEFTSLLKR